MSDSTAGIVFIVAVIACLAIVHRPLGDYMYRVVTRTRDSRVERGVYRLVGVSPDVGQTWGGYARSVLAFSAVGVFLLYGFQRLQHLLPWSNGMDGVAPDTAWNTAVSFVTNTNWQYYSGESTMGHLVQMAGLAVQNFVSAAVGIAVAIVLVRALSKKRSARRGTDRLGNFWVDLTRITIRVLLPISVIAAIALIAGGAVQNLSASIEAHGLDGTVQILTGGPVASQEAIKELGTNGGGFYNANSAHPFENPTGWTNFIEIFLILCIPFSLPRTFGRLAGDRRQGHAITAVMAVLALISVTLVFGFEAVGNGTVTSAIGASMEGREVRFGTGDSSIFATVTTLTSTGAVNSFHDSYSGLGGGVLILNMLLGEVAPGGVGAGLSGMLVLAVITVFIAGLMVGRTPEYLGRKIGAREIKLAALHLLVTPALVLSGLAVSMAVPSSLESMQDAGPHGASEMLYAFASASNNNGSAFAGFGAATPWFNTVLGLCMLFGRFVPIVLVLALAGSLSRRRPVPASAGTLPTHKPLFIGMVIGVTIVLVALTFLPVLALGPLAEGLK